MHCVGSGAVLLKPNVAEITSFFQASNSRLSWRDNGLNWWLRSHRHNFWRNMDRWFHRPTNPSNPLFFLDEIAALESLQVALRPKCGNFACLHTHWARNGPHRWTKFGSKTSDLLGTFQEPIERSDVAWEGRAASVLAQAVFCTLLT